ncbi:MAG: ATP-dependent acyl-CoA ligase [Alphaproteobacteria bacterium]|nr:MAG: ATP-dependent acyl-CoA ligase [Alphaproteobacteria bacterium]
MGTGNCEKSSITTTSDRDCVFSSLLEKWATQRPTADFARFPDGKAWTYEEAFRDARVVAHSLRSLGVRQGDNVLCWLPNGPDILRVWLGINLLGAVFVPFNVSYKGETLRNVLRLSEARLLIGHKQLVPRLVDVSKESLTDVVVIGGPVAEISGIRMHGEEALETGSDAPVELERDICAHDTQSIIFTSGTTGPSKAVLSSYAHLYAQGAEAFEFFEGSDCFMINLPMFHCGGTIPVGVAIANGGAVSVFDKFKIDEFWSLIRATNTTVAYAVVGLPDLLLKQPANPTDRENPLRVAILPGRSGPVFRQRFDCDVYTIFNMSEVCTPIRSERNPSAVDSCGTLRDGIEARLVDAFDNEVLTGEAGELIMRTRRPWMFSHGYANNPEATAKAWRNGWFHTGDLLKKDAAGNFYFLDRLKDSIRRKGENISSKEVEEAVCRFPSVEDAAAIPAKGIDGEEEVMVVITERKGAFVKPDELIEFLIGQLPYFMVPRYVRIEKKLPKTPTGKIQKIELRSKMTTESSWDREAAGIILKKERFS